MMRESADVELGHKRNRSTDAAIEEKDPTSDIKEKYPLIRERTDTSGVKMSLHREFFFDPPKFAQLFDFAVDLEKDDISEISNKITTGFLEGQQDETEKWAKELGNILTADSRLGKLLEPDFLKLLVDFLANEHQPKLQCYSATIIKPVVGYTPNRDVVKQYITPSIILNLVHSKDPELQVQAMWLLRTIVLGIPDYPEIKTIIEGAFEPVISFFSGSTNHKALHIGSKTLGALCQVHPLLPPDKLKSAMIALTHLMKFESEECPTIEVVPHACSGIAYLCDGNKAMIFKDDLFDEVIDSLITIIDSETRINVNCGLIALGSITRWASNHYIEIMIKKGVLWSLECLIREDHKYFVMDASWILPNITARKESHVEDVIRYECIESLLVVVEKYLFSEVKKEAAWTILNAIYTANPKQIEVLRKSCLKALWNFSKVFSDDSDILYACLEVLVILDVMNVTHKGKSVDDFKDYLSNLRGRPFQLADEFEGLPKSKKLRTTKNIGKYDGSAEFLLTCTFEEDPKCDTQFFPVHAGNSGHIASGSANILEDEMEVDLPR